MPDLRPAPPAKFDIGFVRGIVFDDFSPAAPAKFDIGFVRKSLPAVIGVTPRLDCTDFCERSPVGACVWVRSGAWANGTGPKTLNIGRVGVLELREPRTN